MTYLDICNKVLRLMREDTVSTLQAPDDVVVELVKDFVNDARRLVEGAHDWNGLLYTWTPATAAASPYVSLTSSGKSASITTIYRDDGVRLQEVPRYKMSALTARASQNDKPIYYTVSGTDTNGDIRLLLNPTPSTVATLTVDGYLKQPDLSADTDQLAVPDQPVIYYALAMALRERGEVGGQTAAEVFSLAKEYLSNAIANDVALNQYDYDWYAN